MERGSSSRSLVKGTGLLLPSLVIGEVTQDQCSNRSSAGVSFPTYPNLHPDKAVFQEVACGIQGSELACSAISMPDPGAFGSFTEYATDFRQKQLNECTINAAQGRNSINFNAEKLKMPKVEPLDNEEITDTPAGLFKFMSRNSDRNLILRGSSFQQLPDLRSLEQISNFEEEEEEAPTPNAFYLQDVSSIVESYQNRMLSNSSPDSYMLEAIVRNLPLSNPCCFSPGPPIPRVIPKSSAIARERRKKISDRTRCLQKLMPWEKKMDMATMLEEAYKFIKFLQAQVSVLQSMPYQSSLTSGVAVNVGVFGGLEKLNRQQLLQVLVNSPAVQTMLYSQECCVYSLEQFLCLKRIARTEILLQQMLDSSGSN